MSEIKERPILFSAPMVRAILEGRKTVTRRALNERALKNIGYGVQLGECHELPTEGPLHPNSIGYYNDFCPFGQPGDRLWVRETWFCDHDEVMRGPYLKPDDLDIAEARDDGTLVYAADGLTPYEAEQPVWKPSIHMPRWASRILLEITAVRVERLQDISRSDIRAEGLECPPELASDDVSPNYRDWYPAAWRELWESTGGNWDANPWVWVVEFKQVQAESGCGYERGDWECREGGFMFDAGSGEGWDPQDETHICPHCRTRDYLDAAKDEAESCSKWTDCGSSGTGLDIWAGAESHALIANESEARIALGEIGVVGALVADQSPDGYSVVLCNTQQVTP